MKDYAVARRRMVREQLADAGLTDRRVLAAMEEVPRHLFVPKLLQHRAHQPSALPIGHGQTISKPFTVGLMTSLLELQGHEHVLEVGTGSGYQAAILARLARSVISVERVRPLAEQSRVTLAKLGVENINVLAHDGAEGALDHAPYDAIMVTACAPSLPTNLVSQLKDGGHLLIPISKGSDQTLYRYRRQGDEVSIEESVSCRFVPLLSGVTAEGEQRA
ncbi:MAG: protein-L-isoaspartate(D-aspartate) O-methyltransferase [Candidatus Krumholzibacteria bacterium]|nr:protein-L-isoaspartate(D-aspartate) O-methyltransferase [Candidatus Krumholzibacteria bacterium]